MNYNSSSYHRANPYSHLGYMPPIAQLNRKEKSFITEIPQGKEHLDLVGRRQFSDKVHWTNIEADNIFANRERLPALERSYMRSLNTIDIEGASSNTLISQLAKNKIKHQQLIEARRTGTVNLPPRASPNLHTFSARAHLATNPEQADKDVLSNYAAYPKHPQPQPEAMRINYHFAKEFLAGDGPAHSDEQTRSHASPNSVPRHEFVTTISD